LPCGGRCGVVVVADVYRLTACAGGDPGHRHRAGCLPLLVRLLPAAPSGWRWAHGRAGSGWGFWLERVGGAGSRWHVVGLPSADTVADLVAIVEAFATGYRVGVLDGPPG